MVQSTDELCDVEALFDTRTRKERWALVTHAEILTSVQAPILGKKNSTSGQAQ